MHKALWAVLLCHGLANFSVADERFFRDKIAPIFERHCVGCHQAPEPKGGLDLTEAKGALAGGDSGPLVEPGKPEASLLWEMISGDKPSMPKKAAPLTADQLAALRRWITEGARWPADVRLQDRRFEGVTWWAFQPLAPGPVPAADPGWARTPIDAFIGKKLVDNGLHPSPTADKRTLIRRLTFDLHGLPPTPAEVAAFLADESLQAYDKLVERLLASPRYGERWGRHWLDVVHYGESHGYDKDKPRPNAWPYRDYVIAAFNDDAPYSRFVAQQVAGDVLFPDDPRGIVATGFIAAGPWDFVGHVELREGTVDKQIARSNDRDDMVAATMSTFLSVTAHCARCHDHKFDPIKQVDYYRLQAVFAGVDRADRPYDRDPEVFARRKALLAEKEQAAAQQQRLLAVVKQITSPEIEKLDVRVKELDAKLAALPAASGGGENAPTSPSLGYHSQIMPQPDVTKWVQVDLGRSVPLDQIVLLPAHVKYGGHPGPGFGFPPRFRVEVSDDSTFANSEVLADYTARDFAHPGDNPVAIPAAGKRARYVRVTATKLWKRTNDWIFALSELLAISEKQNVAAGAEVTALDSIEAGASWGKRYFVDGFTSRERIGNAVELVAQLAARSMLQGERDELLRERQKQVDSRLDPETKAQLAAATTAFDKATAELAALPSQQPLVYAAANDFKPQGSFTPAQEPRPIHLLHRGSVKTPGPLMSPGALSCLPGLPAEFALSDPNDEGSRRAALAKWLTDPKNALLRRSIVNRVWQHHFGRGLVDTPNDFGRMGSLPTHPELLDWLADRFQSEGESLKQLHRLIVTSAVYRQASQGDPAAEKIDAGNRFLWRMNRTRLDAESVRDAVLAVSGKLDLTMGGPSVQQFFFKDDHSPVYDYERFDVDDPKSNRRCVYRFIVRSVPDPFMECLDCADPSILTPKRNTTLTAIQALAMLNNQFVVKQAEHFAERVRQPSNEPAQQITAAYQLAFGRDPRPDELELLIAYTAKHGLQNTCRLILNSNEFLFVD